MAETAEPRDDENIDLGDAEPVPSSPQGALGAGATAFPKFPYLPFELQAMIWKEWRSDRRGPVRHHFFLIGVDRFYYGWDTKNREFVASVSAEEHDQSLDSVDPQNKRIRIHKKVVFCRNDVSATPDDVLPQALRPAFAWMNFERDIFIFHNRRLDHTTRGWGQLGFLSNRGRSWVPTPLPAEHWAMNIRYLTIHVLKASGESTRIEAQDCPVLVQLRSLRRVFVAMSVGGLYRDQAFPVLKQLLAQHMARAVEPFGHVGLVDFAPWVAHTSAADRKRMPMWQCDELIVSCMILARAFTDAGRGGVPLELVVDFPRSMYLGVD